MKYASTSLVSLFVQACLSVCLSTDTSNSPIEPACQRYTKIFFLLKYCPKNLNFLGLSSDVGVVRELEICLAREDSNGDLSDLPGLAKLAKEKEDRDGLLLLWESSKQMLPFRRRLLLPCRSSPGSITSLPAE